MLRFTAFIAFLIVSTHGYSSTSQPNILDKIGHLRFANEVRVEAVAGEADLRGLLPQNFVNLVGNSLFVPGRFLDPQTIDFKEFKNLQTNPQVLKIPLNAKTNNRNRIKHPATFGTFLLKLTNVSSDNLKLHMNQVWHPVHLYRVQNRQVYKMLSFGELSQIPQNVEMPDQVLPYLQPFDSKNDFLLIAHVSSQVDLKNQNLLHFSTFHIGEVNYYSSVYQRTTLLAHMLCGSFLLMFIFYLFIYLFRKSDLSSLYIAFYAFASFFISLLHIVDLGLSFQGRLDTVTLSNFSGIAALQLFIVEKIKHLIAPQSKRWLVTAIAMVSASYLAMMLLQARFALNLVLLTFMILGTSLIVVALVYAFRYKLPGFHYFAVGTAGNLLFQIPIFVSVVTRSVDEHGYYLPLANFSMATALALVNAKEFAVTFKRSIRQGKELKVKNEQITKFNQNLEQMVDDKTREIRSLLDHIPQGVLSIGSNGSICSNYSAHLESILEVHEIANQSFKSVILEKSHFTADEIDQAWQTILCSIGEDPLSFEANYEKLPNELSYCPTTGDVKILQITWNVEINNDLVESLLVTLLDITAEKKFQAESLQQKQEIEQIQQLIDITPNKAAQFFSTSEPLLLENQRILDRCTSPECLDENTLKVLFINAHTVKGAARTLHLSALANEIHSMESTYANILKNQQEICFDELRIAIGSCIKVFYHYRQINDSKLNRGDIARKVSIDKNFMEEHLYLMKDFLDKHPMEVDDFVISLKALTNELTHLIFDELPGVFESYQEIAVKIANDLEKDEPDFDFSVPSVGISSENRAILDNCMIHLIRNSLDHGIESPAERKQARKPSHGKITIRSYIEGNFLKISMTDDGRGLAISKLLAKGIQDGILTDGSPPQEVAETIFSSGMSTADSVTDISGRGVGMDAVRTFLQGVGGSIAVELQVEKSPGYWTFEFLIAMPFGSRSDTISHAG